MAVGLYISVPFCRTKCSYCNFASDVFSRAVFDRYVDRVCSDIEGATETARQIGGQFDCAVDSIYLGGGTPTLLHIAQLERLFVTISQNFTVAGDAEITVECAPGTLSPAILEALQSCGVNRASLGVQSFVDAEAAAVGRLHKRATVIEDLKLLRAAGIEDINMDLIAGLPHQTAASWEASLNEAIASAATHASVYMLEVDDDSRLGRELLAGGTRYHAHFVPDEALTADLYERACQQLEEAGIRQYEISNFARAGHESRHNLKYWTRQPYLGFGMDAHSMLVSSEPGVEAVRFSNADSLEAYVAGAPLRRTRVSREAALEETFFLGLRLNRGVDLEKIDERFGREVVRPFLATIAEMLGQGLIAGQGNSIWLTPRGRLLSNEVFERFILTAEPTG
jgi:putative oxygen-independent coproporphyrinogen III oxidase